jgi:hypothetical protein
MSYLTNPSFFIQLGYKPTKISYRSIEKVITRQYQIRTRKVRWHHSTLPSGIKKEGTVNQNSSQIDYTADK